MEAPPLNLTGLVYRPNGQPILDGYSLQIATGSIVAIVGRSGCGKSTLLRLIAGLRPLDGGQISGVPARRAFVFQDAALLPWRTARENVALPGEFGPISDVDAALSRVGLSEHAHKLPAALSGGQRMRVSLARALVSRPEVVFLDEAFAALDGLTRRAVQQEFLTLHAEHRWTVILVTHELEDAVWLADRVIAVDGPPLHTLLDLTIERPRPRTLGDPLLLQAVHTVQARLSA